MERTKIKFYIDIPGDYSVGIQDFCANVVVEDDGIYGTKDDLERLREGVACIYDNEGTVITELEFLINSLKQKKLELDTAHDFWNDENSNLNTDDIELETSLYLAYRESKNDVATLKRKISKLKKSYDKMGIWYEGKI